MSQTGTTKAVAAEECTEETSSFLRRVRTATRRRYTAEEKIRTVLEGFLREVAVNELCRREGIKTLSILFFTFSPSLAVGAVAFFILSATSPAQKALLDGYIQLAVPSEYRGRIGSLNQMARGVAALAAFLAGAMVHFLGIWLAIVAAGVIIAGIGVWSLTGFRRHRIEEW